MNFALFGALLFFVVSVILMIGQLELFHKAGYKWWIGLIPIYSSWILITKVAKMAGYWFFFDLIVYILSELELSTELTALVYVLEFFVTFCVCFNIAKKFHKNPIVSGVIGSLFTGLWFIYLGLDKKSQYDDSVVVSPNGPFNLN